MVAAEAAESAWLATALAVPLGLASSAVLVALGLRLPGRGLGEYTREILGSWPGRVIGLGYVLTFLWISAVDHRQLGELIITATMPETPLEVILIMMAALAAAGAFLGLEVLARAGGAVLVTIALPAPLVIGALLGRMRPEFLFPLLAGGVKPLLRGTLAAWAPLGELVFMASIVPHLNRQRDLAWVYPLGVVLAGLGGVVTVASYQAFFGAAELARLNLPAMIFVREVVVARFLTGLDPALMAIWVTGLFLKGTLFFYLAVTELAGWLNLAEYRPLVLPAAALLVVGGLRVADNVVDLREILRSTLPAVMLVTGLGVPVLLLLVAAARGVRG